MNRSNTNNGHGSGIQRRRNPVTRSPSRPSSSSTSLNDIPQDELVDHTGSTRAVRWNTKSGAVEDAIVFEKLSLDFNDIKKLFEMLTDDQRKIVMHIYISYKRFKTNDFKENNISVGNDKPKTIILGPAGTGKTFIINFIEKLVTWEENKTSDVPEKLKVIKAAFTGKAADELGGFTLNNILSIPIRKLRSMPKNKLEIKQNLLKNCVIFMCDEISMVGESTMNDVNLRLKEIFENDELYGGLFVLLVGDLYQPNPKGQNVLYPNSIFWTCCDYYELTRCIRQKDETFVRALNNFAIENMTEEDIKLLQSREIQNTALVPKSVTHIFYSQAQVTDYNIKKLDESNKQEETVNSTIDDNLKKTKSLRVKIDIRYMITTNIDVGDGLTNGTIGVVKHFDYDTDKKVDIIWMEFDPNTIGIKARSNYYNKRGPKKGFENLVPIFKSTIKSTRRNARSIFPLMAAEAITMNKSQGLTFHKGACIHITEDSNDKLCTDKSWLYLALTRVTEIEKLYILGKLNFSLDHTGKIEQVQKELNRLRTKKKLKLAFETFDNKTKDIIIYLNTGLTFKDHHQFISTDKWYDNGSLLIFTETNATLSDKIEIPNFEYDTATALRSGGRVICYKKPNKSVEVISSESDDENNMHLTLLLYEKYLYIVTGVNGNSNNNEFELAIQELLEKYVEDIPEMKCILFTTIKSDVFNVMNLRKKNVCEVLGTNEEKQCDVVLMQNCDIQQENIGFYEYIPSPHKPIYVILPQRNADTYVLNYQKPCSSKDVLKDGDTVRTQDANVVRLATQDTNAGYNTSRDMEENVIPVIYTTEFELGLNKRPMGSCGDSTSMASNPKRAKVPSHTEADAAGKMAIIPMGFPAVKFEKQHLEAIQEAILMHATSTLDPSPEIEEFEIVQGAFHFSCQRMEDLTLIDSVIGKVKVAGIGLKVVDLKDIPKPFKMLLKTKIVGIQNIKLMLDVLQKKYPSLHTEEWEVLATSTSETETEHTILVDQESANVIKASNYKLKSVFGSSYFKLLDVDGSMEDPAKDVDDVNGSITDGTEI